MNNQELNSFFQEYINIYNITHDTNYILKYRTLYPGAYLEIKSYTNANPLISKGLKITRTTESEDENEILLIFNEMLNKLEESVSNAKNK